MKALLFMFVLLIFSCSPTDSKDKIQSTEDQSEAENKEGYIDENGWRQGLFIDSSNNSIYNRVYVNDTLNGSFRKYTKYGSISTTGFYKNKERNGEWIDYHPEGATKSISHYALGLRQGEFKKYYEDGTLKYQGVFNADTMVGNVQNYFVNGNIKSEGNRQNGTWKTYFQNKRVARIEKYSNSTLIGEVKTYDSTGIKTLPIFLPEKDTDTCVINQTDLVVKILYETDRSNRKVQFGEYLFGDATVGIYNQDLIVKFGMIIFTIKPNGIKLQQTNEINCDKEISYSKYGINRVTKELPNGEWDMYYVNEKVKHKTSFGNLTVDVQNLSCDDTGRNPITLDYKGKILAINHIDNLQFFEYDIDKNGSKEIYLLSYASCQGYLKIYKISKN